MMMMMMMRRVLRSPDEGNTNWIQQKLQADPECTFAKTTVYKRGNLFMRVRFCTVMWDLKEERL